MPVRVITGDIAEVKADAVVNLTDCHTIAAEGADYRIHSTAGIGMDTEQEGHHIMIPGEIRVTGGYGPDCRCVFHVYGPKWKSYASMGSDAAEKAFDDLRSVYYECLRMAEAYKCESIAFPLISSGASGYPKDMVLSIAMDAAGGYLAEMESDMLVTIVVFSRDEYILDPEIRAAVDVLAGENREPVVPADDAATEQPVSDFHVMARRCEVPYDLVRDDIDHEDVLSCADYSLERRLLSEVACRKVAPHGKSMEDIIFDLDESWQQCFLRLISEKGMKNTECYRKANVTRACFSKIKNDMHCIPRKTTVCAFAAALELAPGEAVKFVNRAGYALTGSILFDRIIMYCFENGIYNVMRINEILFDYDQPLLGGF